MRRTGPELAVAAALTFAVVTTVVATTGHLPGERRLLAQASSGEALDAVARVVDAATGYVPVGAATALLVPALLLLGRFRDALLTAVCVGGAIAGNTAWKHVVDRGRPELLPADADVSALSYPSGHAAATAALAVAVVLLARPTRWRRTASLAAATFVLVAAAAQLVLARHHPSDLLGGWLWATAWAAAVWSAGAAIALRRPSGSP